MAVRQRVLAYVTRETDHGRELLVFEHVDFAEAGIQVPAGGAQPGETLEEAVVRETREETGIANARVLRKLAEEKNEAATANNHIFHLIAPAVLADTWDWLTNDYHSEEYRARDERLVFRLFWIDISQGADLLAGGQGRWLHLIEEERIDMETKPRIDSVLVEEFVGVAHGNIDRVRAILEQEPAIVNAAWDWGAGDWETALGAAAHMGRADIASFLLQHGARLDLFAAAMLGNLDIVRAIISECPSMKNALGPHGIPLKAHAKAGGEASSAVFQYLETLK